MSSGYSRVRNGRILACMCSLVAIASVFAASEASAATTVTTNGGSGLAATYPDLATAITALNAATITSPVVITVSGTETAPVAGYSITQLGGTSTNTIVIDGTSATTITAGLQVAGTQFDSVFTIAGGDWITIQGFTMNENAGNTVTATGATNTMTEFGVCMVHATATDGAQNNTIQNNIITLNVAYPNSVGIFSTSASSPVNASLDATSTAGTNSNNKVYGNNISNVAYGIYFICPPITATVFETGNDIGGTAGATGNTVTYGNAAASSGPWNRSTSTNQAGIVFRNGAGNNIRFNSVTSNSAAYVGSAGLNGIQISSGTAPVGVTYTSTISDNTVNITSTGVALMTGIDFGHGLATGTIVSSNNNVTVNTSATAADSAAIIGIKGNYTAGGGTLNTNTVTMNQAFAPAATATNSSAVTALTVPGGTTGSPTVNALGNTITINRSTNAGTGVTGTMSGTQIGIQGTIATTLLNVGSAGAGNNNTVTIKEAIAGAGTSTYSSLINFITVSAAHATVNVKNNTLNTTGSTIRSMGNCIGVFQDATVTVLVDIQNNTMNVDRIAASGSLVTFQSTSGSPSEVKDIVSNNNITFTSLAGTTVVTGISSLGGPSSPAVNNKAIEGNTISISGTHSGTTTGIGCSFTNTGFIRNNSITATTAANSSIGITTTGAAMTISGNTLSLTSSATAPTNMQGIVESGAGAHSLTNNTFSAMNLTGVITTSPTVAGYAISGSTGGSLFSNTITNISVGAATSSGSPVIDGILVSAGVSINVFKNKICGITTAATGATTIVSGIRLSGGGTASPFHQAYNNTIGALTAPASANPDSIRGINVTSATASTTYNVYYNSVHLNASSTGANFGTTGIFHAASATATTAALSLRNNAIINNSTFAGTGLTVAYRRSSGAAGTLANYASTSNNNDFYAGTPGASNLIFADGIVGDNTQTITAYKNGTYGGNPISPRDSASLTENPPFLSTTCGNSSFLHLDTTIATQLEAGAAPIAGITDDYDGETRNVSTPDIGADEGGFVPADFTGPAISYTAFGPTSCLLDRTISATITDPSGVNNTAGTKPRLYYKKSTDLNTFAGNTSADNGWKFVEASNGSSPFSFTTNYALLQSSVAAGDVIQYFVVAQDLATTPNVGVNAGTFNTAPTSVALVAGNFPISGTSSYTLVTPLGGTVTIGAAGTYTSLTNTGGLFDVINNSGLSGDLTANIIDAAVTENGTVMLNAINNTACSGGPWTLTIKPTTTAALTGSNAGAIIRLNGADNVTIDGSIGSTANTVCPVSAASRDLTITNTNAGTSSAVIWIQNAGADGSSNNTVKNCNIVGNSNTTTLIALGAGGPTIGTAATASQNNTSFVNNNISKCLNGIYSAGVSAAVKNTGTVINQNLMNTVAANNVSRIAIILVFDDGGTVSGNNIGEIISAQSADSMGISLGSATGIANSTTTGADVTNATVTKNVIGTVRQTNTFSAGGIFVAAVTTGTTLIADNMIAGVSANGTLGDFGVGIFVAGGTGSTTRVYYNSVTMVGTQTGGSQHNYALAVGSGNPIVDIRNNILVNTQSTGTGSNFAVGYASTTFTNMTSDHNDYFVTNAATFFIGGTGSLSAPTTRLTVTDLQTATGKDGNAQNVLPVFISATNLHLSGSGNGSLDGTGVAVSVTDDIDCETRTGPDIGADEFTPCTPPTANVTPAGPIAICAPNTQLLTANTNAATPTYQWRKDGIDILGATNSTLVVSASGSYTVFINDTTTSCSNLSNAVVVTVNAQPNVNASATPSTICPNGSSQLSAAASDPLGVNNYALTSLSGQTYTQLSGGGITVINSDAQLTAGFATGNQDDGGAVVTLPFTFTYMGSNFTQMCFCTNGWISAGNGNAAIAAADSRAAGNLFTTTVPNRTIAAWFKDMGANWGVGFPGSMRHGLIGTDVYAFQWDQAVGSSFSNTTTILISFQINIYGPGSSAPGRIEMIYGPTLGSIAFAASEGVEDATGGTNHYLNALTNNGTGTTTSTVWPGNGNGWRFDPVPFSYSWSPATFLNNANIANPLASGVTATTMYTVTATSSVTGCSNTANTTVTVSDTTPPQILNCPSNISVNNDPGLCSAVVTWTAPNATDDCTVASFGGDHNPGDTFPVGDTLVTYTATDTSGNPATPCTFHVVVNDVELPTLANCPTNISQNTDPGQPYATVTWTPPTPSDNCPGVTMSSSHNPGAQFLCGQHTVTYQAEDAAGNDSLLCSFTVTVTDVEFPVFTSCPTNILVNTDPGVCTANVTWPAPTATDNKGTPVVTQTQGPPSGSNFPKGTTHVQFRARDPQGNDSFCNFDVIVSDAEAPTVVGCPANIATNSNTPVCSAVVTWTAPTPADNCPGSTIAQIQGPPSGSTFAPGVTTIKYRATDTSSNVSIDCTFTVTVTPTPDVNNDGVVDLLDVPLFAAVLADNDTDPLRMVRSDANCDGLLDGRDVAPFVDAILP